jgi:hypothetical protein
LDRNEVTMTMKFNHKQGKAATLGEGNWIYRLYNHNSQLFRRIELLLPWQSPEANVSFHTRILLVLAFTAHVQCYLLFASRLTVSPGFMLFYTHIFTTKKPLKLTAT